MSIRDAEGFIIIRNARLSYPALRERKKGMDGQPGNYGASLLLDPNDAEHAALIAAIREDVEVMAREKFGRQVASEKVYLRDGNFQKQAEYHGMWFVSAGQKDMPVALIDRFTGQPMPDGKGEAEAGLYAGCYVNAKIRPWCQDNKHGQRINAGLIAVQWAGDGDAFTAGYVAPETAAAGFGASASDPMAGGDGAGSWT